MPFSSPLLVTLVVAATTGAETTSKIYTNVSLCPLLAICACLNLAFLVTVASLMTPRRAISFAGTKTVSWRFLTLRGSLRS
ncbi:hypothetical protein GQ54DRAFT_298701 [Martensiomyces pterosporus]|nr:hypothetical protein GQ54DRAFT_298701 [Martensiomyces pterosporus]